MRSRQNDTNHLEMKTKEGNERRNTNSRLEYGIRFLLYRTYEISFAGFDDMLAVCARQASEVNGLDGWTDEWKEEGHGIAIMLSETSIFSIFLLF